MVSFPRRSPAIGEGFLANDPEIGAGCINKNAGGGELYLQTPPSLNAAS